MCIILKPAARNHYMLLCSKRLMELYCFQDSPGVWKCHARLARLVHIPTGQVNFCVLVVRGQVKIGHVLWGRNQISFDNCQYICTK